MPKNALFFSKNLITWYLQNKRDLPWRNTIEPYFIWLSEIILQQTRVDQGLPYYLAFSEKFPTVEVLAEASEEMVLKIWQGLGYYSRARNLHATANYVSKDLNGIFPKTYSELIKLKGIGDYTASAIASICYNAPTAVVDGNVYRVLARVFGIATPINSTLGIKEFKALAQKLLDVLQPGAYNQAIMEFGARYCVPQNPNCNLCIFNDNCVAFLTNKVSELPVKLKKNVIKKRYFNYLVCLSENHETLLQQRTEKGIWQQLYEFPLIETEKEVSLQQLKKIAEFREFLDKYAVQSVALYNEVSVIHKLSHQHLYTRFWIVYFSAEIKKGVSISEVYRYPVPTLIQNFISKFSPFNT